MGLIKAIAGAAGGVMADQWKEYFYCEAMPANILATKGHKKVTGRSSNYKGDENIITNGSMIAVADGQCMLIVEQGKVVEVCAEPGEFLYDTSTEPSIFSGKLGDGIGDVFRNIGKRFTFGGEAPKDQRVYYFNTKELIGNKYGTASPVPFRVVDQRAAIDIDVGIRCFGEYSYHIANPLLFYTNVCGNVSEDYDRSNLDSQLKTELLTALQPAFAKISEMGIRYSALPGHTVELADALNDVEASQSILALYQLGAQQQAAQAQAAPAAAPAVQGWTCSCGQTGNTGKFCANCGKPAPVSANEWTCSCGAKNTGKFCSNCGKPAPAGEWTCACGTKNSGKFCSNCGKPFGG